MWEDEDDDYWEDEDDSPVAKRDDDFWLPEHQEGRVNWLGDPWPYVAGDPAY